MNTLFCIKNDNKWVKIYRMLGSYVCETVDTFNECTKFYNEKKMRIGISLIKEDYNIENFKIIEMNANNNTILREYDFIK